MQSKKFSFSFLGIILLFQVLPLILSSCLIDNCSPQAINYRIEGLNGRALEYIRSNPWQSRPWSNDINLTTDKLILAFTTVTAILGESNLNNSMYGLPVTLACDPAIKVQAGIQQLKLYSDQDFNSDFKAGSNLIPIVMIATSSGFEPFANFVDPERNILNFENAYIRFSEASDQTEAQNFTCEITLTDGKKFSATIENIKLRVN